MRKCHLFACATIFLLMTYSDNALATCPGLGEANSRNYDHLRSQGISNGAQLEQTPRSCAEAKRFVVIIQEQAAFWRNRNVCGDAYGISVNNEVASSWLSTLKKQKLKESELCKNDGAEPSAAAQQVQQQAKPAINSKPAATNSKPTSKDTTSKGNPVPSPSPSPTPPTIVVQGMQTNQQSSTGSNSNVPTPCQDLTGPAGCRNSDAPPNVQAQINQGQAAMQQANQIRQTDPSYDGKRQAVENLFRAAAAFQAAGDLAQAAEAAEQAQPLVDELRHNEASNAGPPFAPDRHAVRGVLRECQFRRARLGVLRLRLLCQQPRSRKSQ
jgi:hypothetical protein